MMEVEYELTLDDIRAFHANYSKRHPVLRRKVDLLVLGVTVLVICISGFLAAAAIVLQEVSVGYLLLGAYVGLLIGIFIGSLLQNWQLKRMTAPKRLVEKGNDAAKILGWARVLIDAQGVHVTDRFFSCHYGWNGLEKLETTDEYVFFYVTTSLAQIVPMRAFADGRAFDAFADEAKRYHAAAGVGEGPTGIRAPDPSGKLGTVEGIIPKGTAQQK